MIARPVEIYADAIVAQVDDVVISGAVDIGKHECASD